MKDNSQRWIDFLDESCDYPESLSGVEHSLEKRIVKEYRKKRTIYSSLSVVAAAFLFVILVNTSTAFASGILNVPVIGKLAELVKFDKSLSNAIENEYVQEVDLTAWDGQERLILPYVIADEKNLVLFYQLPKEFEQAANEWVNITLKSMTNRITGEKIEGFINATSSLSIEAREENDGLVQQLLIQKIGLLDKEEEYITVDLNKKTITPNIAGTELIEVTKTEGKASLVFSTKVSGIQGFGLFSNEYKDEEGNSYELQGEAGSVIDSLQETSITVEYPTSGKIILQRALTPNIILEEPIRIDLPVHK